MGTAALLNAMPTGHQPFQWTADLIAARLVQMPSLASKLLVVPTCSWYGHEADLLVIENKLRIIDIEIKISRADLKADAKKDKWWRSRPWSRRHMPRSRMEWPEKVWKHYYAMPASVWSPDLADHISDASGIILIRTAQAWQHRPGTQPDAYPHVWRRAVPNRDAKPINVADVFDIARLSSLRYWSLIKASTV